MKYLGQYLISLMYAAVKKLISLIFEYLWKNDSLIRRASFSNDFWNILPIPQSLFGNWRRIWKTDLQRLLKSRIFGTVSLFSCPIKILKLARCFKKICSAKVRLKARQP